MNMEIWENFKKQARPKTRHHLGLNDLYDVLLNLPNINTIYKDKEKMRQKINNLVQVFNHFITT